MVGSLPQSHVSSEHPHQDASWTPAIPWSLEATVDLILWFLNKILFNWTRRWVLEGAQDEGCFYKVCPQKDFTSGHKVRESSCRGQKWLKAREESGSPCIVLNHNPTYIRNRWMDGKYNGYFLYLLMSLLSSTIRLMLASWASSNYAVRVKSKTQFNECSWHEENKFPRGLDYLTSSSVYPTLEPLPSPKSISHFPSFLIFLPSPVRFVLFIF